MNSENLDTDDLNRDANPDPITGAPGSHPVGTGLGSATGAATGAAIGAAGGPVGMAVGGVIGAIAGAAAGHAAGEALDPTAEDAFWKENYKKELYYDPQYDYGDYGPAYRMGYEGFGKHPRRAFEDAEPELSRTWMEDQAKSRLAWEDARHAVRAGWHRVERGLPGDADGDGR